MWGKAFEIKAAKEFRATKLHARQLLVEMSRLLLRGPNGRSIVAQTGGHVL